MFYAVACCGKRQFVSRVTVQIVALFEHGLSCLLFSTLRPCNNDNNNNRNRVSVGFCRPRFARIGGARVFRFSRAFDVFYLPFTVFPMSVGGSSRFSVRQRFSSWPAPTETGNKENRSLGRAATKRKNEFSAVFFSWHGG